MNFLIGLIYFGISKKGRSKLTLSDGIQIILAIITIIGIGVSFWINQNQVRNSNKQKLFEQRLSLFSVSEQFRKIIDENPDIIRTNYKNDSEFSHSNGIQFKKMVNNSYLIELSSTIISRSEENGVHHTLENEQEQNFLLKRDEYLRIAKSAEFIFAPPEGQHIGYFISAYIKVIDSRRLYELNMPEFLVEEECHVSHQDKEQLSTEDYLAEYTNESKITPRLLKMQIETLECKYKQYSAALEDIVKQIDLLEVY